MKQALTKLKLDGSKITGEELHLLLAEHSLKMVCLQKFVQLQGALSPCIESLIILDRLLFIQENVGAENANILQLFDARTSPRCFAIIGHK